MTWTNFKALVTAKTLNIEYKECAKYYYLFAIDVYREYTSQMCKASIAETVLGLDTVQEATDITDFEDNYKSTATDIS